MKKWTKIDRYDYEYNSARKARVVQLVNGKWQVLISIGSHYETLREAKRFAELLADKPD